MSAKLIQANSAAGTALTNTTTETVLSSVVLPAGSFLVGKTYRVRGSVRATATNSTDTLRIQVRLGPTTLTGTAVFDAAAVDVANDNVMVFDLEFVPRATLTDVAVVGFGSTEGAAGTVTMRAAHAIVSSLVFTVAQRIEVTGTWSVASASNSCICETFNVYEAA